MLKQLAIAAGTLGLMTALALAQATPPPGAASPTPGAGTPTTGAANESAPRGTNPQRRTSELEAIRAAKVSLGQAIDTAEQRGQGKAISAEFETKGAGGQYEVKVLSPDGKLVKHLVDAGSGQVTASEDQPFERYFTRLKPADVQAARAGLKQAITAAEQKTGGKVIEAEVEREGDSVEYELTVATGDKTEEVKVDANGQVKQ